MHVLMSPSRYRFLGASPEPELFSDPSGSLSLFDEEVEEGGAAASEVGGVTDEQLELMEPLVPISDAAVEKGRLKILHQLNKAKERS